MLPFRISYAAVADMKNIARYTEKYWGRAQRNQYLQRLDRSFHQLTKQPLLGQPCDAIRHGCRKYLEGKHIIFYRPLEDNQVEIILILHQHMDPELHL